MRLADALTAVSLATDAGKGAPLEKSLRTAVIATRLGVVAGLREPTLAHVYQHFVDTAKHIEAAREALVV
jgi:ABC-type antimicrobial peptide transport system permease subunit